MKGDKQLRVLFLSMYDPYSFGGPANHLRYLSQALSNLGCEVHVLTYGRGNIDRTMSGVQVHYLKNNLFGHLGEGLMFSLLSIKRIRQICRTYKIDILHGQSPSSFGYAMLRDKELPYVVTLHGTSFAEISSYLRMPLRSFHLSIVPNLAVIQPSWAFLTAIEYRRADKLIAVSEAIAEEAVRYYGLPRNKIHVIHNGVTVNNSCNSAENLEHTMLCVGRLVWRKGFKYLIDAITYILPKYPDAKLLMIGDGEDRSFLELYVRKLKIENSVSFLGNVTTRTLYDLYSKAMVYVQPSLYEPFSIATLEAMSMGKPVVAARVGGTPEVVIDEETGLLVEPRNSRQLADAVNRIFSDDSLRKKLSREAIKKVQNEFSWKKVAEKTFELYRDSLKNG